jgi:hypothetical protein
MLVCWCMLVYAGGCWCMLVYAGVPCSDTTATRGGGAGAGSGGRHRLPVGLEYEPVDPGPEVVLRWQPVVTYLPAQASVLPVPVAAARDSRHSVGRRRGATDARLAAATCDARRKPKAGTPPGRYRQSRAAAGRGQSRQSRAWRLQARVTRLVLLMTARGVHCTRGAASADTRVGPAIGVGGGGRGPRRRGSPSSR